MTKIYTGIGSRDTPDKILFSMEKYARILYFLGYTLRSGGANGADMAFENGARLENHKQKMIKNHNEFMEIYLPWKDFNKNTSSLYTVDFAALDMAKKYHPAWGKLSWPAQKLMARNCYQVLGEDLKTPTDFIICWTKDGKASGGTGQALRIAKDWDIKVYNLFSTNDQMDLIHFLNDQITLVEKL